MHNYNYFHFHHFFIPICSFTSSKLHTHLCSSFAPHPPILPWTKKSHVFPKWTGWEIEAGLLCLSSHSSVTLLLLPSGSLGKLVTAAAHMPFFFPCLHTDTHIHTHTAHSTLACLVLLLVSGEEVEVGVLSNVQLTHIYAHRHTHTQPFPPLLTPWLTRPVNCTDRTLRLVRVPLI